MRNEAARAEALIWMGRKVETVDILVPRHEFMSMHLIEVIKDVRSRNPDWDVIHKFAVSDPPTMDVVTIRLWVIKKTEQEIFRERFDALVDMIPFYHGVQIMKESKTPFGCCPECKEEILYWEPMFGGLAPEWWATMRERGIDPASGHRSDCKYRGRKLRDI